MKYSFNFPTEILFSGPLLFCQNIVKTKLVIYDNDAKVVYNLRKLSRGHGDFFVHSETARNSQGSIFILNVSHSLLNMH